MMAATLTHPPFAAESDLGCVRERNEDFFALVPKYGAFILADGMGGRRGGDCASKLAVESLQKFIEEEIGDAPKRPAELIRLLARGFSFANSVVYERQACDESVRGMGSTLCCVLMRKEGIFLGHVGDSRIYRLHKGSALECMSSDHSLVNELVQKKLLTTEEAKHFAFRNVITRAVGIAATIEPTIAHVEKRGEQRFLLCSDGVTDMLSDAELEVFLRRSDPLNDIAKAIVAKAKENGGLDNITAVLCETQHLSR